MPRFAAQYFRKVSYYPQRLIIPIIVLFILGSASCQDEEANTMTRSGDPPATFSQETETPFESNPTPGEQNQAATDVVDAESSTPEDLAPTRTVDIAGSSPTASTATSVRPTEPPATSTPTPSLVRSIKLVPFSGAFARPTELVHANDERVFVVEQAGKIWIIEVNTKVNAK